jgi:hypothetical protein
MKPNTVGRATGQSPLPHPLYCPAATTGFVTGTLILTQKGETPVEDLRAGDRIITRDVGMVTLTGVSHDRVMERAILFSAGSLGHTRPDQDLILPASQQVLIRDWRAQAMFQTALVMVEADRLVDGEFIRDMGLQPMELYQLQFDTPHVVYAGGMEVAGGAEQAISLRPAA